MFVWWFVKQAKLQKKTCVHVLKLDKKVTLAGKLMWLLFRVCGSCVEYQDAVRLSVTVSSANDDNATLSL